MFHKVRKKDFNLSHRRRQLFDNVLFMPTHLPVLFSFPFSSSCLRFTWGHFSYCSIFRPHSRPSGGCSLLVCGGWPLEPGASQRAAFVCLGCLEGCHMCSGVQSLPLLSDSNLWLFCHLPVQPAFDLPLQMATPVGLGSWLLDRGRTEQRSQLGGGECRVGRPWSLHLLLLKTEEKLW